ncbi:efflux RND transporter permease subunit [Flagellatimonas centrodinii]|uniref:efflux RND transporter permease subunit n=1 Tax=Flagellatimonas centrodinii TaxID=2806210 RepID=UPI001FEE9073|nr:efflux RND transporter permease subunit [Flagellatimonas centrodinii]ULQ48041.1 efflux RND transporter permease subunit [Flagellatimonas centrodinii]
MHFTDIFIKRPVLATVISLIILLLGLRAGLDLTVREYPELQNAQITVSVAYPGADPALIEGFITTPLEREIATADGIDYLTSSSVQNASTITANLRLTKDPNEALTEIAAKVNKLRSQLPEGSEDPVIQIAEGGGTAAMYLSFYSEVLDQSQITDYLSRVVEPQLSAIEGMEKAEIIGARTYAMRVWLKPERMAAHNITASEVYSRLRSQNVLSAVGETKGNYVRIGLSAGTDVSDAEAFRQIVVKAEGEQVVRLGDVADVQLGAEVYEGDAGWDGTPALFIGVQVRPEANVLDVIDDVMALWPDIVQRLPEGLNAEVGYDSTVYIRDAISEVRATLIEALLIVIVVIYLFLGSLRNSFIPAVTVPLSLVGALFLMMALGFTINLLTLLAMVLAIGMVVDDAIIVMENIHRHIEDGMKPHDAAIQGARELVGPVIAMTITLVAVYAPIGFLGGITGKLFTEFAFTLAGAVLISGVVALTLTPMMCARILKSSHDNGGNRLAEFLDRQFEKWRNKYKARLHGALDTVHVIGVFGLVVLVSCYFLFVSTPAELAPAEDPGFAFSVNESDGYSTQEYLNQYFDKAKQVALDDPDVDHIFTFGFPGNSSQAFMGFIMKPWSQRERSAQEIIESVGQGLNDIAGLRSAAILPPALPTPGQGYPVEFVIKATASPEDIAATSDEIVARAQASKKFFFVAPRLRIDRPETRLVVDRDRAALLGVDMQQLSADLAALLAGGEVNRFSYDSRSYKVIQQVERGDRLNPAQLANYHTRAANGQLVPLSSLVRLEERTVARSIEHVQQLNADTIIAVPRPDVPQGEALKTLEDITQEVAPPGFRIDYGGASRQFKQEGSALMATFGFALVIIYLVLAAQFESFRDPLIILVTVPMSICGALLLINILGITNGMQLSNFPGMTLNIYTQVGLITLIGVISKHGILMVEFANKLQEQGFGKREAIEEAASIRMRPILMTTAALVVAMFPLLFASGPGASARFSLGLVIAAGMTIGTLFTLYVVPAAYLYIGRDHGHQGVPAAAA